MRSYLLLRFRTDGDALHQRAAALRDGLPQPGPDAAMSSRMADACDDVAAMIEAIPDRDANDIVASALLALIPLLEKKAATTASTPPVRAVYVGAATRIREVVDAERRHAHADDASATTDDGDEEQS